MAIHVRLYRNGAIFSCPWDMHYQNRRIADMETMQAEVAAWE